MIPSWLLGAMIAVSDGSGAAPPSGPAADPIAVVRGTYSGGKIMFTVTVGDPSAETRVYEDGTLVHTIPAGGTTYSTGRFTFNYCEVSHYKNGIESGLVGE